MANEAPTAEEMERQKRAVSLAQAAKDSPYLRRFTPAEEQDLYLTVLALHARVAELEKDRQRLIGSNEHWHLRVGSLLAERDLGIEQVEAAEARATTAEATLARYREALEAAQRVIELFSRDAVFTEIRAALDLYAAAKGAVEED